MKDLLLHKYPCRGAPRSSPALQTSRKDSPICIYCLGPTLEGQKMTIGRQGHSLDENDRPELQYLSRWAKMWLAQWVACLRTSILGLVGRVWSRWARISTPIREYGYLIMLLREYKGIPHFSRIETPWVLGRDSWRLLGVLGNSLFSFLGFLLHPWRFYPFWVGEDDGLRNWRQRCEWEAQLNHGAIFKNLGRGIVSTLWFQFLPYSSIL